MDGFKLSINLAMPTGRPDEAPLCGECGMKHAQHDECETGISPAGDLPLPDNGKYTTGRELVDNGMDDTPETDLESEKAVEESLVSKLKSGAIRMATNVKKKKKEKKHGA